MLSLEAAGGTAVGSRVGADGGDHCSRKKQEWFIRSITHYSLNIQLRRPAVCKAGSSVVRIQQGIHPPPSPGSLSPLGAAWCSGYGPCVGAGQPGLIARSAVSLL